MAGRKLTVVISQAPGKNPNKRQVEEDIATRLMLTGTAEVSLIPHLYDLSEDHHSWLWLRSISTDMVVLGWLYPRATRWVLDRNEVRGLEGLSLLPTDDENSDAVEDPGESTGIGAVNVPNRKIYVLDLRQHSDADVYLREIERIANETSQPLVSLGNFLASTPAAAAPTIPQLNLTGNHLVPATTSTDGRRRWYPVIDYSRCTNCMECLDFCLFGVYGVDGLDRILVEEQDNCKRGCPACSRVCPANAIIFPEHKTPAIAGAPTDAVGDFKIDLSKLFGAPSALEIAAQERDVELVADGRDAVGLTVGIPKRRAEQPVAPRDALDDLMDGLDALDL